MCTAVIAGGDAPPVLEPAEPAFNAIALLVELSIIGDRLFAVGPTWDTGRDRPLGQGRAEPVAVIPLIGDQDLRVR